MSPRPLVCSLLAAVVLAGCGSGTESDVATEPDVATDPATEAASATPTHAPSEEGEGRSADALFGQDVCTALLPALDGETEGLDSYAEEAVLAELSDGAGGAPIPQDAQVSEGDVECYIVIGDLTWTLELMGDGHVGQRAVSISSSLGIDSGGAAADPDAIADAVAAYRDSGESCVDEDQLTEGAPTHNVYELSGVTVVGVICGTFAYQSIFELMVWDGALFPMVVEQWQDGAVVEDPLVLGYPYIEGNGLVNLEKARGIGDCGRYQEWVIAGGDLLELVEARSRECDDDAEYIEPWFWELQYGVAG